MQASRHVCSIHIVLAQWNLQEEYNTNLVYILVELVQMVVKTDHRSSQGRSQGNDGCHPRTVKVRHTKQSLSYESPLVHVSCVLICAYVYEKLTTS